MEDPLIINPDAPPKQRFAAPEVGVVARYHETLYDNFSEDENLDYPEPYSEMKAQKWAKEDPLFSVADYRQDSYFDKDMQAELRRRIESVKSGREATIPWEAVKANVLQN